MKLTKRQRERNERARQRELEQARIRERDERIAWIGDQMKKLEVIESAVSKLQTIKREYSGRGKVQFHKAIDESVRALTESAGFKLI